ncbi:hypothetical protein MHU86_6717 [Fragilaria crotonensis]|nr:hypothetical protein MHU86_6717 [Fragilaria crotonensis]
MKRKITFVELVTSSDLRTIEPHPYGCLPTGNIYLAESSCKQLPLSDEIWQQILGYTDGVTLGFVVQTCREFYVAGHQPELWRDLVLRESNGETLQNIGPSWKDTFVERRTKSKYPPHKPITISGFYSDFYYRTHLCRSFAIPEKWLRIADGTIDRVENLSIQDFLSNYEELNKPVVLVGACKSWKATQNWKSMEYLDQKSPGRSFRATSGAAPLPADFTLRSYYNYCSHALEEAPMYLFDRAALLEGSELRDDYYQDLQTHCPFFDPDRVSENTHDLFQLLGEGARPDHTWLIVGPQRSGSSFHIDPNATHAWNAAICGRKRWIFYPPGVTPPGVHPSPDGDHVAMPISLGEWLNNFWDAHMERYDDTIPLEKQPLECTVEAGDVLFVPHGWWHSVVNLDPINVAVTHNYVSRSNLSNVLRFLVKKEDQISGCRDREESIKPEALYEAFVGKLKEHYPEWLETAQRKADEGWTCAAWNDGDDDAAMNRKASSTGSTWPKRKKRTTAGNSILAKGKSSSEADSQGFSFSFNLT